jgi:primosomal replication protein N
VNRVELNGVLISTEPLRRSLTGAAVLACQIHYEGVQPEAGHNRKTRFDAACVALGEVAERLAKAELGSSLRIAGFLAPSSLRSTKLLIHITEFEKGV